jgi:hypothetical protein
MEGAERKFEPQVVGRPRRLVDGRVSAVDGTCGSNRATSARKLCALARAAEMLRLDKHTVPNLGSKRKNAVHHHVGSTGSIVSWQRIAGTLMMTEQRKPWFRIKGSGYGLTPTTWQGWCLTLVIMAMLLASVQVELYLVHDPLNAVILILVVTGIELAVFIPFMYRHAESSEEAEKAEASLVAEKRQKIKTDIEEWKKRNSL